MMYKLMIKLLVSVGCALAFSNAQAACYGSASDFYCNQYNYNESMTQLNTPPPVDNSNTEDSYYASSYSYTPPKPSQYGAIASDDVSGAYGYSNNQSSEQLSGEVALADCGTKNCVILDYYKNQCAAIASGVKNGLNSLETSFNLSKSIAGSKALANCRKKGYRNCIVLYSGCSLP